MFVDNTFLTAAILRPLDLGATASVYSTTKYLEGHNSTLGGAIVTRDEALRERLAWARKTLGSGQGPFEAWLTLRGLKTLELRMQRHSENALEIARFLENRDDVQSVAFPGLDPSFGPAGGMLGFDLVGGIPQAERFLEETRANHPG